jgi:hypothetical protein
VLDLVRAALERQDDLRAADAQHGRELAAVRHAYEEQLRSADRDEAGEVARGRGLRAELLDDRTPGLVREGHEDGAGGRHGRARSAAGASRTSRSS